MRSVTIESDCLGNFRRHPGQLRYHVPGSGVNVNSSGNLKLIARLRIPIEVKVKFIYDFAQIGVPVAVIVNQVCSRVKDGQIIKYLLIASIGEVNSYIFLDIISSDSTGIYRENFAYFADIFETFDSINTGVKVRMCLNQLRVKVVNIVIAIAESSVRLTNIGPQTPYALMQSYISLQTASPGARVQPIRHLYGINSNVLARSGNKTPQFYNTANIENSLAG